MSEQVTLNVVPDEVVTDALTSHEQNMINKAEGTSPTADTLIAGKYKTEADAEKGTLEALTLVYGSKEAAYKAVESLIGKRKSGENPPELSLPEIKKETDSKKPLEIQDPNKVLTDVGLDFKEFNQEFQDKGQLSEASYTKLAAKGLSKDIVDTYIDGLKAKAELQKVESEQVVKAVYDLAGGKESFDVMVQWASSNLSEAEIKVLNEGFNGDKVHATLAAESLKQKYTTVNGKAPLLYMGSTPATAGDVFRSQAELTAAMKDPRYKNDPAYQNDVIMKLGRSKILG